MEGGCMKIDTAELMERLRIADSCENCPRHEDGYCKGHLSWLCKAVVECSSEEEE